jgi:hypothetical protein
LAFAPLWKQTLLHSGQIKRQRSGQLAESAHHDHSDSLSPITLSRFQSLLHPARLDLPACGRILWLVSYSRFVRLIPSVLFPLAAYLEACRGQWNGLSFVDSRHSGGLS